MLRLAALVLALVTLLVYLPVGGYGFSGYDDPDYITENHMVQAGLTWAGIKWAFTTFHASNWHPLTWISHMVDCACFGDDPGAQHLVNVVIHALNAVLVLLVLRKMTRAVWASMLVAALFALHPLHVESVAWLAERKDVLSTAFVLFTLWTYCLYVEAKGRRPDEPGNFRPAVYYISALFLFALGLMSKPMLVTLPCVLLLLDYWPLGRWSSAHAGAKRALVIEKLPFFALSIASCAITVLSQRAEAVVSLEAFPLGARLSNVLVSYVRYLGKTVWPAHLAVLYPLRPGWPWPAVAGSAILLLGISWWCWKLRPRRQHLLVGWAWFLGTLVPVIGLVQVGVQALGDRYTYIPLIGIFIGAVFEARFWVGAWRLGPLWPALAVGVMLLACVTVTERQLPHWRNRLALFSHMIAVTGGNATAHVQLGIAFEEAGLPEKALSEYEQAVRLQPDMPEAHLNIGNVLKALGKPEAAIAQYEQALRLKDGPAARQNLGIIFAEQGRGEEALRQFTEAARLAPGDPLPRYHIGYLLCQEGRSAEGAGHLREALRLDPNHVPSLLALARLLASDPNPQVRNGPEALRAAMRADALLGAQSEVLDILAMALAECGRFPDALKAVQQAIERSQSAGRTNSIPEMRERLRLYESNTPYRAPAAPSRSRDMR